MSAESILPTITSVGGGFLTGVIIGYFLKKIIRIIMFVARGVLVLLLYLEQQQIISVNIEKLEGSFTFILNSVVASFDKMTQIGDGTSLGIPPTVSMTAGFTVGIMKA